SDWRSSSRSFGAWCLPVCVRRSPEFLRRALKRSLPKCAGKHVSCHQPNYEINYLPNEDKTMSKTILVTGVTGNQGGAVAQALQGSGFRLRGLTRRPESERAAALARHGVDVVKGDLDDEATLRRALAGAWGVFG